VQPVWHLVDSSAVGGIERHVSVLAQALAAANLPCEVVLYTDHGSNPWLTQLDQAGVGSRILGGRFHSLHRSLRLHRPALLHTHGYKAGILGRIAARLTGTPVVSTFHAGERGGFPVSLYQAVDEWLSILAERIAVSSSIAAALPFPATVVPNFVFPVPAVDRPARRAAFVGRLSHEKGPDRFCQIAEACDPSIAFDVYGDGPMRSALEARHRNRVTFHGFQGDMDAVWPEVGVLVMPSRAEGLPMAALEALSHGIPVVASPVGGLPDLLQSGRHGETMNPDDLQRAASCVSRWSCMEDGQRRATASAARAEVAARFGPGQGLRAILQVYRRAGYPGA
jgi:glycosyltransferase involved in cell wall biosynthesis